MNISENIENIRKVLIDRGDYGADMESLIELAATDLYALKLAQIDLSKLKKSYVIEKSREGNKKYVPHPVFAILKSASDSLRKTLTSLNLTLSQVDRTKPEPKEEEKKDGLTDFMDAVNG